MGNVTKMSSEDRFKVNGTAAMARGGMNYNPAPLTKYQQLIAEVKESSPKPKTRSSVSLTLLLLYQRTRNDQVNSIFRMHLWPVFPKPFHPHLLQLVTSMILAVYYTRKTSPDPNMNSMLTQKMVNSGMYLLFVGVRQCSFETHKHCSPDHSFFLQFRAIGCNKPGMLPPLDAISLERAESKTTYDSERLDRLKLFYSDEYYATQKAK